MHFIQTENIEINITLNTYLSGFLCQPCRSGQKERKEKKVTCFWQFQEVTMEKRDATRKKMLLPPKTK